jgi:hypothetical protein
MSKEYFAIGHSLFDILLFGFVAWHHAFVLFEGVPFAYL